MDIPVNLWYFSPMQMELNHPLSALQKAVVTLALSGGSVIDWSRLHFTTEEEITRFLKINEFDLAREKDTRRLVAIYDEAINYLKNQLHLEIPLQVSKPEDVISLFLINSKNKKLQKSTCSILKTMNIINHLDGRELLYNCPISLRDLFSLVEDKVERVLSSLTRKDPTLLRYEGGRKSKESLITKLLSKRETIAAQINDRVRYHIVTRTKEDMIEVMLYLFETILPFNYVIPGGSMNQLIPFKSHGKIFAMSKAFKDHLPTSRHRDYSGKSYKVCKFVVDIPIRMDNFLATSGGSAYRESLGTIAYVLVEFQIVDEKTAAQNNEGDNSHENYKNRQKMGVVKRLLG